MSVKKKEIVTLLTEAKNQEKSEDRSARINYRHFFLILFLFIGILTAGLLAYLDLRKDYRYLREAINLNVSDSLKRAEHLEAEKKFEAARERYVSVLGIDSAMDGKIREAINRLDDRIRAGKEVQAYLDKIQIKNLRLRRNDFELRVAGNIVNTGKRYLNEIEITIYCLDDEERPVCEKKIITIPSDGKPLRKYQKRKFNLVIPDVPNSAEEVQVIVSDIEFVEVYQ